MESLINFESDEIEMKVLSTYNENKVILIKYNNSTVK